MNIRNSKQREAILAVLKEHHHAAVDEIYSAVREKIPRISLATVYRNLDQLCRIGKVVKIESAGWPARYDCELEKHFHIKCHNCGKIDDVFLDDKLENYIDLQEVAPNFNVTGYKIDFYGLCPACRLGTPGEK